LEDEGCGTHGLGPDIRNLRWDGSNRSLELTRSSVVALLWYADVQEPFDGLDICQSWINFFWQNMDRKYFRPVIPFADMPGMTSKNDQAVGCHTQNSRHRRISRALNKKAKFGSVPIKVITQELLLRGHPVLQVKAMLAAVLLKNLVRTSGDCRLDNLLMSLTAALDRYYPVVQTLSAPSIHSSTSVPPSFLITHTWTVLFQRLRSPGAQR